MPNSHAHIDVAEIIGGGIEAALHLLFRAERLDNAHSAQCFLELRHRFAPFLLGFEARLLESAPNAPHRPTQGGKNYEGEERKFPRDVEQTAEIDRNENGVLDQHLQTPHDRVLHLAHVAAHAGDDVAFALIAEEREGK